MTAAHCTDGYVSFKHVNFLLYKPDQSYLTLKQANCYEDLDLAWNVEQETGRL